MNGPILLLKLVEFLFALAAIVVGTYQTVTMVRDRRDAKRDAEHEAEYQAKKDAQKAQEAAARDAQRAVPPPVRFDKPDGTAG